MGRYLNSSTPYALYQGETNQPYFVDKSLLLAELFLFGCRQSAYLYYKTKAFWKDSDGKYDRGFF